MKELSDEITRHATEHALADGRNLAADIGFVTILEMRAATDLGSQTHEARSRSEAQCPEGLAHEAHRARFFLVVHLDLRVIGAANTGNTDHDLSRVAIRTILREAATSRDDGGKLARIQEPPPHLLHGSGERDFPASRQRAADGRPLYSGLRCQRAPFHVTPVCKCPDAVQVQRQRNIVASERIRDSVCDRSGGEHGAAVSHPLRAERIDGRGRFDVTDLETRYLDSCRTKIIGKSPRQEIAPLVIRQLFEQSRAQTVGKATVHLSFDDFGIELGSDVVNRDIFADADRARRAVDLNRREIDHEAECEGGGNPVFVIGRAQDRRRHDGSFMNSGSGIVRQAGRVPMRARRCLAERQSLVGLPAHLGIAFAQLDLFRSSIQGVSGQQFDFVRDLLRALRYGIDNNCRKAVRIVSRRDRPSARERVDLGHHVNVVGMQSERVGYDLRRNRCMTLAIGSAAQAQRDLSARIDRDHGTGVGTRFAVGTAAVFRRLRQ